MLNYKECSDEEFINAMREKNEDVTTLSTEHLYILYTKFQADARHCFYAASSYARDVGAKSENQAKIYKQELQKRGVIV